MTTAQCLECGVDIGDLFAAGDDIEWCETCAGWPPIHPIGEKHQS